MKSCSSNVIWSPAALTAVAFSLVVGTTRAADNDTYKIVAQDAQRSLEKGIAYFHSIAIQGGYVYHYTLDLKQKWGEGRTDDHTIEVQPPGTPAVGMSFLRAYAVTKNPTFLKAAQDAGDALIRGQTHAGGWEHKIHFNRPKQKAVSFDDNQTQSAIRFLMALDQEVESEELSSAVEKALDMMMASQMEHGAWPHRYPKQWDYHDFSTFNDGGVNDCLRVMVDAHQYYGTQELLESINKAGWFLILSQLPPPQPGWAQQYNQYLQPAWARAFEPPAVCPQVTVRNLNSLIDLYLYTGSGKYLEPIPDALRWLDDCRLPNGKWARFIEIGTGKALYYDRGRIRVDSTDELSLERRTGYGYESDLSGALEKTHRRFDAVSTLGRKEYLAREDRASDTTEIESQVAGLVGTVRKTIQSQDDLGRWIVKNDRYRRDTPGRVWNGEYESQARISSKLFNDNVAVLCKFLELSRELAARSDN